jgi:hypothetical protein
MISACLGGLSRESRRWIAQRLLLVLLIGGEEKFCEVDR